MAVAPWHKWCLQNIVYVPGGWFFMNMYFCFIMCWALKWYMGHLGDLASGFVQISRTCR